MPPQKNIENVSEGENGAGNTRPTDNLTGSRTVDDKTVQAVQRTNLNFRSSMSDIPTLGTLGKSASSSGFAITDGDQVIASKMVQWAPQEPIAERTYPSGTVINQHGKLLLETGISNVPEVSQGIQNLDDLEALANGLATDVSNVACDTLNYLSKPNAVGDSLISIGPALDTAVNYCANTPPGKMLADAQDALGYLGQALEDTLGHPLTPEQRGQRSGEAMAMMFPWGVKNAEVSEKFPKLLATADNVSGSFTQQLERAVGSLPPGLRQYLENNGQKFVGVKRLADVPELSTGDDTILSARGKYQDNKFFIAEEHFSDGQWVGNQSIDGVTRHEVGHSVNTLAGQPERWLSERADFKAAYDRDIAAMSETDKKLLGPLISGTMKARDEVFSELFALRIGGPANANLTEALQRTFPETLNLIGGK